MGSSNIDKLLAKKRFGRRKVGKSSQQKKSEDEKFDGPKSSSKVTIKTGATSTSTEARTKKRAKKTNIYKKKPLSSPFKAGLLKISNIPFGFFEEELKGYFGQFGRVLDAVVVRHPKTFRIQNYAYVKFAHQEVAKIAAESMNNYLMYDKLLKCRVIGNVAGFDRLVARRKESKLSTRMQHRLTINQDRTDAKQKELIKQKLYKIKKAEEELAAKGISFKCITLVD